MMPEINPDLEWLEGILRDQEWRYAKTMPQTPHDYTLRHTWHNKGDFFKAVKLIREHGYFDYFQGRAYTYYRANGYVYWTMGSPVFDTILINRALAKEEVKDEREGEEDLSQYQY